MLSPFIERILIVFNVSLGGRYADELPQNAPVTGRVFVEALVIKSSVHFPADYEPIAQEIIFARADGMNLCDLQDIDYKNLRSGVRPGPHGPVFHGTR